MAKAKKQSFLHGAVILVMATAIVKIIGAIYKIPLTDMLGSIGMGYYGTAYNIFNVIYTLAVAGLPVAVSRLVAESAAQKRFQDVKKIFKIAIRVFLVTGTIGFIILFFGAGIFSEWVGNPMARYAMACIAPAVLFGCLMGAFRGYYQGLQNMYPTALSQVCEALVKLFAGLLFAKIVLSAASNEFLQKQSVFGSAVASQQEALEAAMPIAAAASILGVSLSTFVGFVFLFFRHKIKGDGIHQQELESAPLCTSSRRIAGRLVRIAVPICLGAVVFNLTAAIDVVSVMNRLQSILQHSPQSIFTMFGSLFPQSWNIPQDLSLLSGTQKEEISNFLFGSYQFAINLFNLIPALTATFGISALPAVTAAWTLQDHAQTRKNMESVLRITSIVAIPAGIGMCVLSNPILSLIFGRNNPQAVEIAAPMLSVLAIAAIFLAVANPSFSILQAVGRVDLPVKIMLAGGVIKLAINFFLVSQPNINIYGASIGTLVCYLFIMCASVIALKKVTKIKLQMKNVFLKPLLAGLGCGVSAFVFFPLLHRFLPNSISTVVSIGIGAAFYAIILFLVKGIAKDDILMLPKGEKIAKLLEKRKLIG